MQQCIAMDMLAHSNTTAYKCMQLLCCYAAQTCPTANTKLAASNCMCDAMVAPVTRRCVP
jgi:hypothetical protein